MDILEHTGDRRVEVDPGGELEVAALLLVAVDDPVAFVEDDELPAAGEHGGHPEIQTLLVVSPAGEVEGAWLAEHAVGDDVDAPPTGGRSATEHIEGRLVGQLPDPVPRELRSDLSDPLLNRGIHIGELLAQRLLKHLRPERKRSESQRCEDHCAHLGHHG